MAQADGVNISEMDAQRIALMARLFRLLADRPEFLTTNVGSRIDAAWTTSAPGSLPALDRWLVTQAGELDRLCGYAVAKLRSSAPPVLLDVLGLLDPERIVAIYYAMPEDRRSAVLRDGAWGYYVGRVDPGTVAVASADWDEMPSLLVPDDVASPVQIEIHRFGREAQRYRSGLPHGLAPHEVELVNRSSRKSRAILAKTTQEQKR